MAPDDPADDPDLRARVAQLEATVEAQQETIQQLLPSRRRVLQAGGLVAGGGVLGALTADRASAQASGQVGTSSDPVDVEAFDLAVQNQLSSSVDAGGNDLTNVGSVKTEKLGNDRLYAGAYSGADADARLDAALTDVSGVSVLYLEEETYSDDRTIGMEGVIAGVSPPDGPSSESTRVEGVWTLNNRLAVKQIDFRLKPIINNSGVTIRESFLGNGVTVSGDYGKILGCSGTGGDVTFKSGTGGGLVDSCTRLTVTDNGSNTSGDIA